MSLKIEGYCSYRLGYNWRERLLIEALENDCHCEPTQVLFNSDEFKKLSPKEQEIARKGFITALQWLGTNVGWNCLETMLQKLGCSIDSSYVEQLLTNPNLSSRQKAIRILKKRKETEEECEALLANEMDKARKSKENQLGHTA